MINLTHIISAAILVVAAIVCSVVVPYIRRKIGDERFKELTKWTQIAVQAAEMIYKGVGLGEQKKAYVLQFLADHGYTIDTEEINAVIEAAVLDLHNAVK